MKDNIHKILASASIAIAAPSPVPFVVGGAEKLWWGLQDYINKHTAHHCELIKICTPELNFGELINSYYRFYHLDLTHFDMVLSTKYPAWMLRHPNHHVYFQHPLRGLYERYEGTEDLSPDCLGHPGVKKVLQIMGEQPLEVGRLLDACMELASDPTAPAEALAFPGPLLRKIVYALDHRALGRVVRISAISQTVKVRPRYFPVPEEVGVIHHPSNLQGFYDDGGAYLLTASRLVYSKRVHLILQAYLQARIHVPLKIVGRGPELDRLRDMATGHDQVEFTGFVSDKELVELYSRALAVIFIPEDEDLGLITLEAMHSGKPVITFTDSGGAAELVRHGETGWVCPPDTAHLARTLREVVADRQKAARMGQRAREDVSDITWENMASALFGSDIAMPAKSPGRRASKNVGSGRRRLAVLSTFPVYPPRGGGQARIFNLYKAVAADFDVFLVCLGGERDRARSGPIAPGLWETRIPMPGPFKMASRNLAETLGMPAVDLAAMCYPELLRNMGVIATRAIADCDLVVLSHPYTLPLVRECVKSRVIYEAHNVEYDLKRAVMAETSDKGETVIQQLREIEQEACEHSLYTMACSTPDIKRLTDLYALNPSRALLVPNGVDPEACVFVPPEERGGRRKDLGIGNTRLAVFLGSDHPPNIQAVTEILTIAESLPDYRFVVIGSVGDVFSSRTCPENVGFTGEISEKEKRLYLSCADVALNPVVSGSGTNLKILEYIAFGLPVVSTHFGARGFETSLLPVVKASMESFADTLKTLDMPSERMYSGREVIEKNYSWSSIGRSLSITLQTLLLEITDGN